MCLHTIGNTLLEPKRKRDNSGLLDHNTCINARTKDQLIGFKRLSFGAAAHTHARHRAKPAGAASASIPLGNLLRLISK